MARSLKAQLHRLYYFFILSYSLLLMTGLVQYSGSKSKCRFKLKNAVSLRVEEDIDRTGGSFSEIDNPYKDRQEWKTFFRALQEYKKFHREKLRLFKSSPDGGDVRTLTWACSQSRCSGLGDQLFRLQYFLILAIMSDRVFTIYWDEELRGSTDYLLPNDIDWSYFNKSKGMCGDKGSCSHHVYDCTSIWNFGWTNQEFASFGRVLFSSTQHITVTGKVLAYIRYIGYNYSILDSGDLITEGMNRLALKQIMFEEFSDTVYYSYDPLWYWLLRKFGVHQIMEIPKISAIHMQANDPWLHVCHTTFTYLFRFPRTLLAKVREFQQSLGLYKINYLSLHLRTGFMGTQDQENWLARYMHSRSKFFPHEHQWDCLIRHTITLRGETVGPHAPIYLSTNSDLVKDKVRAHYTKENIVFGNLTLVHSGMSHDNQCEETDSGGHLAMWLDFLVLAGGKVLVHSDSSFSINAGFLRPIPHVYHSWVMYDTNLGCLASNRAGNISCIC